MVFINGVKYRATKKLVVEYLKRNLLANGYVISEVTFISDNFNQPSIKHVCPHEAGFKSLVPSVFTFRDEDGTILVNYVYCSSCGKLMIYREFM